jgi:hypothetical protein
VPHVLARVHHYDELVVGELLDVAAQQRLGRALAAVLGAPEEALERNGACCSDVGVQRVGWVEAALEGLAELLGCDAASDGLGCSRVGPSEAFDHLRQPLHLEAAGKLDAELAGVPALDLREVLGRCLRQHAALLDERANESHSQPFLLEACDEG